MLTKSQQVRQYQLARHIGVISGGSADTRFDKYRKGNPEFNPDQPRGNDGRWSAGGAAAAALGAAAAGVAGVAAYRNRGAIADRARRMFGLAPKPKTQGPRSTKPYASLSPRQQRRREAEARQKLMERGATKEQADAAVRRMKESASVREGSGSRALVPVKPGGAVATLSPTMAQRAFGQLDDAVAELGKTDASIKTLTKELERNKSFLSRSNLEDYEIAIHNRAVSRITGELATARAKQAGLIQDIGRLENSLKGSTRATPKSPSTTLALPKPKADSRRLSMAERLRGRTKNEKRASASLFDSVYKYDPSQRRENDGRFADEGRGGGTGGGRTRKPKDTAPAQDLPPEGSSTSDNWALARDLGLNAALIGATLYGGPAVSAGGRAVASGGRRIGRGVSDLYNRLRNRRKLLA
jgi:hypothetical protein